MGFRLSRQAEDDLVHIYVEGAGQFGAKQARRYHRLLEKCFHFLAENPEAARERTEIVPPVRVHPFGSHLIIYSLDTDGDILVIRIRHGHEDWINDE